MTSEELNALQDNISTLQNKLLMGKGHEYHVNDDALSNFKDVAASVGVLPTTALRIYMHKHLTSINNFLKQLESISQEANVASATPEIEKTDLMKDFAVGLSEPIEGRILDAMNYLVLLWGLLAEMNLAPLTPSLDNEGQV